MSNTNEYYNRSHISGQFGEVARAFNKLPALAGNAGEVVVVNSAASALESVSEQTFNSGIYTNLSGYLKGCIPSNNGSDTTNDIDFSTGFAFDGIRGYTVGAQTKRGDATWASGTGNGGRAAGVSFSANTDYHWFLLCNTTTGGTDFGFDTSVTATNLLADSSVIAAGFTVAKRAASFRTGGSAAWPSVAVREYGLGLVEYLLKTPVSEFSKSWSGGADNTAQTGTLASIPGGIQVTAIMGVLLQDSTASANSAVLITSLDQSDTVPDSGSSTFLATVSLVSSAGGNVRGSTECRVRASTSRTFRYRAAGTTTDHVAAFCIQGWVDSRV